MSRRVGRDHALALGFAAVSFGLAFLQRPGWATSDTKIDLHVDPAGFLSEVASVWAPSIDLGAVQGAQYSGYLWPMGPVFALLDAIGLSPWVAHRVWLGLLFALSAWGMLKLLDAFVGRPRGLPHVIGAGFYLLNPYTVIFSARTSVVLLGYAALPWLLLIVHRGVRAARDWRDWRGWWWAAAFALILTSTGGGVNAAVVGWMLVGPLLLLAYEPLVGSVRWRDAGAFLARIARACRPRLRLVDRAAARARGLRRGLPSVHRAATRYLGHQQRARGAPADGVLDVVCRRRFLRRRASALQRGGHPAVQPARRGGLPVAPGARGRRLRADAALALRTASCSSFWWSGAAIEVAGFPNGTPAREGMEWVYRNVSPLRFLRTTQKAAPLVAVGVGGLLALFVHVGLRACARRRAAGCVARGRSPSRASIVVLILLSALPLVRGDGVEEQLAWKEIPAAWEQAGRDLDRELPRNTRALVLPGQIFAYYDWGGTIDAILPRLTERPVAVRFETPYADPHANDLLWTRRPARAAAPPRTRAAPSAPCD